ATQDGYFPGFELPFQFLADSVVNGGGMLSHNFAGVISIHAKVETKVVTLLFLLPAILVGNQFQFTVTTKRRALARHVCELSPTAGLASMNLRLATIRKHKPANIHD